MNLSTIKGCIFGGAIGDALGKPVEKMEYKKIVEEFGFDGITDLLVNEDGIAETTDDTQMTVFAAEGVLRAEIKANEVGIAHYPSIIYQSYLRWLITQDIEHNIEVPKDGWLFDDKTSFPTRDIDMNLVTILSAGKIGNTTRPINRNKSCNGITKIVPIGLTFDTHVAFEAATEVSAITHGHPTGYLAGGYLAYVISLLVKKVDLEEAIYKATLKLRENPNSKELLEKIYLAMSLAEENIADHKAIEKIGKGWNAEEALAIAIYSIFKHKNKYTDFYKKAVLCSINHDGDSNTTGNITGSIVGAFLGIKFLPREWVNKIESKNMLDQISSDLFQKYENTDEWMERYPAV